MQLKNTNSKPIDRCCYNCKNIEVLFNATKWCNRKSEYVEYTDVCEDFEENN